MPTAQEVHTRMLQLQDEQDQTKVSLTRRWLLQADPPIIVEFYVLDWPINANRPTIAFVLNGDQLGGSLTSEQLTRLAAMRLAYEDWLEGRASDVPIDPPR